MPIPIVLLTVFLAAAALSVAAAMVIRDLFVTSTAGGRPAINVRRAQIVVDHSPAATALGRFDQWFNRMIAECGLGVSPMTALLLVMFSGLLAAGATLVATNNPLATAAAAAFLMCLTLVWFQMRRARRMSEIQQQLPDVIDLMARAVHAGENLEQAIALVSEEMSEPLGPLNSWIWDERCLPRCIR